MTYAHNLMGRISQVVAAKQSEYHTSRPELAADRVLEPIKQASPEVRRIVERVLQAEKDKLHLANPRHINDDILLIIKEEVKHS